MCIVVGSLQSIHRKMRVDLRGHEMRVTEKFLNTAQIRARIEQMRGVTVTEFVRRQRGIESGGGEMFFETTLQNIRRDGNRIWFFGEKN
jgi:hypothetical protein